MSQNDHLTLKGLRVCAIYTERPEGVCDFLACAESLLLFISQACWRPECLFTLQTVSNQVWHHLFIFSSSQFCSMLEDCEQTVDTFSEKGQRWCFQGLMKAERKKKKLELLWGERGGGGGGVSCPLLLQQRLYGAAVLLVASLEIRWFEFGLEGFSIVLTSGPVCAWHREVFLHLTINQSGPSPPGTGAVSLSLA